MKLRKYILLVMALIIVFTACGKVNSEVSISSSSYIENNDSNLESTEISTEETVTLESIKDINLIPKGEANSIPQNIDLYNYAIEFYENIIGKTIDIGELDFLNSNNVIYKKCLVMGIIECDETEFNNICNKQVELKDAINTLTQIYIQIQINILGNSDVKIGVTDISDEIEFYENLNGFEKGQLLNMDRFWTDMPVSTKGFLTYRDTAEVLVRLFDNNIMLLNINENTLFTEIALNYKLLEPFPKDSNSIDENAYVYQYQLDNIVNNFTQQCIKNKNIQNSFNNSEMERIFKCLYEKVKNTPIVTQIKVVDNSKDYFWYYNQNNTGTYSEMNCMPTVTCMAIKWTNEKFELTPEDLRNENLLDGSGWYPSTVKETLSRYNVVYEERFANLRNIISDLDDGAIIITQFSLADISEYGHCMIIYGYEKRKDSVQVMVYDPQIYPYNLEISNDIKNNKSFEIKYNGVYAEQIIQRFTNTYIKISKQ